MANGEFNSLCRLCVQLLEKEEVSPIFNNKFYEDKVSLRERIKYCSSVEVAEDDGLPPQICSSCLLKLDLSFTFRNQCVLADITLKHLKEINVCVNEIPDLLKIDISNQAIKPEKDIIDKIKHFLFKKENEEEKNLCHSVTLDQSNSPECAQNPDENNESIIENYYCEEMVENIEKISTKSKRNKERIKKFELFKENNIGLKNKSKIKTSKRMKLEKTEANSNVDLKNKTENEVFNCSVDDISSKKSAKVRGIKRGKLKKEVASKEKPTSYPCDYCQKVYPSEGGWRYHIYTMHNENYQPFICDLCGQTFKVKKNLEGHKNSVHFHLKLHLCDLCGRGFASKYALKVHKIWHNDEKNFSCDICGTKFRTRGKMNTHKSIHGGPKKFMCHICSRDFRWKKDFEIHMRTHTGEKPFKCSHCGKAFASLTNMKKHERSHVRKLNNNKNSELFEISSTTIDDRLYRNGFLDFEYETQEVRNKCVNTGDAE